MLPKRILAYGEDTLVISTRAMILRRAGYEVIHTTQAAELIPLLRGVAFDLLLVGDSIRMLENVRMVKRLREHFPELPIVMVQDEKEDHDPWSTAFVSSNPEQMLNCIVLVLEVDRGKPAASEQAPQLQKAIPAAAGR